MGNQMDFSSRIGLRGVMAATVVTLSMMTLLVSLLAGVGLWNYRLNTLPDIGSAFWYLATLAWFVSVFVGGFMVASSTRSTLMRDGIFNALTTWSASYLIFGAAMMYYAPIALRTMVDRATTGLLFVAFLADAISLAMCLYGGALGVRFERGELKRSPAEPRRFEPAQAS